MIVMIKAQKGILSLFQRKEVLSYDECWNFLQSFTEEMIQPLSVDIELKHSQYTIVKNKGKIYLLYNTLYSSMVTMSDIEFKQYKEMSFTELNLIEGLTDNGFLIPNYTDEFQYYQYYQNGLFSLYPAPSHYTVVLTTKCNARCTYCYEEGVQQFDMTEETAERFAELLINSEKDIDITWFGGEPLIKTNLIEIISRKLHKNGKDFTSSIITNGSLLTNEMIQRNFLEWNIGWVQITIDGMAEEYAKRKRYYDTSTDFFNKIIKNIDYLINNKIHVSVRLNMDSKNYEECIKVAELFKEKYPENSYLDVHPAFLVDKNNSLYNIEKRVYYSSKIYSIQHPESELLIENPKIHACFFQQPGAFVIDTDGSILCCDRDVGKQKTKISDIFSIDKFDDLVKLNNIIPETRMECESCVYYPKCGGGCRAAYYSKCEYDACFMIRYKIEFMLNKIMNG